MGRQYFERLKIFAATTGKKKPQETNFDKHWHPEQSRVVKKAKDVNDNLGQQKNNPKDYKSGCVE